MFQVVLGAPVLVKVLGALLLILVINRFHRHLAISVAVGAVTLGLWSGHSFSTMVGIAGGKIASADSLLLLLIIFQVIWLSSQMSITGVMEDLVAAVRAVVSQRAAMAALPAVIGFLPMPGGALFSAPLVDRCDVAGGIAPPLKAQTNHWFRHVWEYWWPLYPGVLLAMEITHLEVWQFMIFGAPLCLCAIGAGYFFLLRRIPSDESAPPQRPPHALRALLVLVLPILVVIGGYAAVRSSYAVVTAIRPGMPHLNRYVPMVIGLCAAGAVLQVQRPLGRAEWKRILLSWQPINMAIIVAMILVYSAFVEATLPNGQPLVAQMHAEMTDWGIPLVAVVVLLPLVSGLATGLSVGFVGASFPIVIGPLVGSSSFGTLLSTTVLAYGFGYMGMLLSPVHVCLIVTSEHFHTGVLRNIAGLLKPAAVMLLLTVLLHFLLG